MPPYEHSLIMLNLCCHMLNLCLTLNAANLLFLQDSLIIWALIMTLTLKIAKQSFHMIYRIIMTHHDTRLGYKRFYGSEDTFRTNINWNLKPSLWPWSWTKETYIFPWHSSLWLSTIKLSLDATESSGKVKGEFRSSGHCSWVVCILCPLSQSVCYCWWHSVCS